MGQEIVIEGPKTGSGFVIRDVWVALVTLDDTDEAVPAVLSPDGIHWVPLIAADSKRLVWLKEMARVHSRNSGKPVKIVKFTTREDLEVIKWGS